MNTTGRTPSMEKRGRGPRIAPRRHGASADQTSKSVYDSSEFPVLLRMPDVSLPGPLSAPEDKVVSQHDEPTTTVSGESSAGRPPRPARTFRHDQVDGGSLADSVENEQRVPGSASVRFWSTIPPQVAAGGMLLAVIGLCFVMLRGSDSGNPTRTDEWSTEGPSASTKNMADVPPEPAPSLPSLAPQEWKTERSSVAAKPVAPALSSPTPAKRPAPASVPELSDNWREAQSARATPTSSAETSDVQGWPDESLESGQQQGPSFNGPLESSGTSSTGIRTSQLELRSEAMPQPQLDATPRLNGTVEIPPPNKIYRQ